MDLSHLAIFLDLIISIGTDFLNIINFFVQKVNFQNFRYRQIIINNQIFIYFYLYPNYFVHHQHLLIHFHYFNNLYYFYYNQYNFWGHHDKKISHIDVFKNYFYLIFHEPIQFSSENAIIILLFLMNDFKSYFLHLFLINLILFLFHLSLYFH